MKTKERIKALEREIKEIKESLGIKTKLPDDYTGWVVDDEAHKWMAYFYNGRICYGFKSSGEWFYYETPRTTSFDMSERPATKEEVEQRLKAEFHKKYDGKKFTNIDNDLVNFFDYKKGFNTISYAKERNSLYVSQNGVGGQDIMRDGKWAEIIEQPKLNNIAVENLTLETGKEIIRLFQKLGFNTDSYVGGICKSEGFTRFYYGVFDGKFHYNSLEHCQENNIKIITLDQLRELAGEKERTFPRMMWVRDDDDDDWEKEEIQLFHNGLYWCYCYSCNDRMIGYKQFKEID